MQDIMINNLFFNLNYIINKLIKILANNKLR